uniref:Uncharacterized protein n=1 Tax=Tetranychus urticae TaxID=32264 RepID=T1L150_TETUR
MCFIKFCLLIVVWSSSTTADPDISLSKVDGFKFDSSSVDIPRFGTSNDGISNAGNPNVDDVNFGVSNDGTSNVGASEVEVAKDDVKVDVKVDTKFDVSGADVSKIGLMFLDFGPLTLMLLLPSLKMFQSLILWSWCFSNCFFFFGSIHFTVGGSNEIN